MNTPYLRFRHLSGSILSVVLCAILLQSCQQESPAPIPPTEIQPATLTLADSTELTYEVGTIRVPFLREQSSPKTWDVEFVRFKRVGSANPDTPPLFILRGGPGSESATQLLEDPSYFEYFLEHYTRITDIVIPGQRGFQTSGATPCDPMQALSPEEALNDDIRIPALQSALSDCRQRWESELGDLSGFNVVEMASDVSDIARSLGYHQIQLMGQSFGSHWGMEVIRQHPKLIARATLSGLEGPDHTYDMPAHVAATLGRIAQAAETSPELKPLIPEGGLIAAYQKLIEKAEQNPIPVSINQNDKEVSVLMDGDAFRLVARGYSRGTAWRFLMPAWPTDILNMLNGSYEGAARRVLRVHTNTNLDDAAYYQVDCASGISESRGAMLRSDPGANTVGRLGDYYDTVCAAWDADLGEGFRTPFTSNVPTVLVHGNWDTSTPYDNALEVRTFFTNHRFVHVESGSHGAFREAQEDVEGFREQIHEWLRTGNYENVPEYVELPPLPWRAPE